MPKPKNHKGLLKRVRITGKGKVKFKSAFSGHLRSKKTGNKIRKLRHKKLAKMGDMGRFEIMLQRRLATRNEMA